MFSVFGRKFGYVRKKIEIFFCARSTQNVLKRVLMQKKFFRFFDPIFGHIFGTFFTVGGVFRKKFNFFGCPR